MTVQDIGDITSFKWATVTSTAPLGIKLDGDTATLDMVPESLVDPLTLIVNDRVRVELTLRKCIIHGVANAGAQSGEVKITVASTAPRGWLLMQGQSLLRADYPRLFAVIGTTYGSVDGTHFNLPDLRGRVVVGYASTQAEFDVLGETGGAKTHTLTSTEVPGTEVRNTNTPRAWRGSTNSYNVGSLPAGDQYVVIGDGGTAQTLKVQGGGAAHNNLQPYMALNYIIKY